MVIEGAVWAGTVVAAGIVALIVTVLRRAAAVRADPARLADQLGAVAARVVHRRLCAHVRGGSVVAGPLGAVVGRAVGTGVWFAGHWPAGRGRPRRLGRWLWAGSVVAAVTSAWIRPMRSVARVRRVP